MNTIKITHYDTPAGQLIIGSIDNEICLCDWMLEKRRKRIDHRIQKNLLAKYEDGSSPMIEKCISQLNEYFTGQRTSFDIPVRFSGTNFQNKVWSALMEIPFGETTSYGALAARIGMPTAVRAVANANASNPISILVPCHRVIGSDGSLTGYGGGLEAKRILLALEKKHIEYCLF